MPNLNPQMNDESAAVVVVEVEILRAIYVLMHLEANVGADSDVPLDLFTRQAISKKISDLLNAYFIDGEITWSSHTLDMALITELFEEIKSGVSIAPVFIEDAIGFTVHDGSMAVLVHFNQEGLDNARSFAS